MVKEGQQGWSEVWYSFRMKDHLENLHYSARTKITREYVRDLEDSPLQGEDSTS